MAWARLAADEVTAATVEVLVPSASVTASEALPNTQRL